MLRRSRRFLIAGLGALSAVLGATDVWNWERIGIALGCGLRPLLVLSPNKGFFTIGILYPYVRLLLAGPELIFPARDVPHGLDGSWRVHALLYAGCLWIPHELRELPVPSDSSPITVAMEGILRNCSAGQLQGQVQCFDLIFGCLNSLYHLGLVENTGYTGDLLLFPTTPNSGYRLLPESRSGSCRRHILRSHCCV